MNDHHVETSLRVPAVDVAALLSERPARWLRGFLRLAAGPGRPAYGTETDGAPWYRIGEPETYPDGRTCIELIWWPHIADGAVFERFAGEFVVIDDGDGTRLELEGRTEGGSAESAGVILARLLRLLAQAMSESHGSR